MVWASNHAYPSNLENRIASLTSVDCWPDTGFSNSGQTIFKILEANLLKKMTSVVLPPETLSQRALYRGGFQTLTPQGDGNSVRC